MGAVATLCEVSDLRPLPPNRRTRSQGIPGHTRASRGIPGPERSPPAVLSRAPRRLPFTTRGACGMHCTSGNRSGSTCPIRSAVMASPHRNAGSITIEGTMLIAAEAFSHLPMLVGKIVDPGRSTFRIARQTFDDWDRRVQEAGYGNNWRRTHEDREATRSKALSGRLG